MASSDSDEEYTDEEEDSEYSDYDEDDDDEDDDDEEEASDDEDDDEGSDDSLDEDEDEDELEEGEEEEEGDEDDDDGIEEDDEDDSQALPALEHPQKQQDEISLTTDGPFSGESTPDGVSPNGLALENGAELSLTDPADNAENEDRNKDAGNVGAREVVGGRDIQEGPDLEAEAKDDSSPPLLMSSLPGNLDNMKIQDTQAPADFPANKAIDDGSSAERKGQ